MQVATWKVEEPRLWMNEHSALEHVEADMFEPACPDP